MDLWMIISLVLVLLVIVYMSVRSGKKKQVSVFPHRGPRTSPLIDMSEGPGPTGSGVGAKVPKTPLVDSGGNPIPKSEE